ncbi:Spermidine/putrescine ABC transporter, spermidine/putrescine-binding protein, partial [human gut metagenome]
ASNHLLEPSSGTINFNFGFCEIMYVASPDHTGAYPSKEVLDKCEVFVDLGDSLKLYDDAWMNIKTAS